MNFWKQLPRPFFALAPMEDVTDSVFRRIVADCAAPDVYFTEFTSVEGLCSKGEKAVSHRLKYTQLERPIVAQIWGTTPQYFFQSAQKLVALGFDGIDINMGCPQKKIVKTHACAALINNPSLAQKIIQATKEGISSTGKALPLSVKTRLGFSKLQTAQWIGMLLEQNLDALTIHGRTAKEMSDYPVHWDEIKKAVQLRNKLKLSTLILGNGDIKSRNEGLEKIKAYGLDGIMIGRGVFENLWVFEKSEKPHTPNQEKMLHLLLKHVRLFESEWGSGKNFAILKRFFKIYTRGLNNASELREQLMKTENRPEIELIINEYISV